MDYEEAARTVLANEEEDHPTTTTPPPEKEPLIVYPLNVVYCNVCGYPTEYCEYSPLHAPPPTAVDEEDLSRTYGYTYEDRQKSEEEENLQEAMEEEAEEEEVEGEEGNGNDNTANEQKKCIEICTTEWGIRKYTTTISGLSAFGIQPRDAAKLFRVKFSCSVTRRDYGKTKSPKDEISIQGNLKYEMYSALLECYSQQIKQGDVYFVDTAGIRTVATP